jgi:putative PIN family toxin of toxin-antitoxin system
VRIVLDTNVLLAAFATRGLCEAVFSVCLEGHDLVTSEHILGELGRHLAGKLKLPAKRAKEIVAFVREHAEVVEPAEVAPGTCRDPDDLPVLGTALSGRAELLVTGDAEVLAVGRIGGADVVSPRECHRRLS